MPSVLLWIHVQLVNEMVTSKKIKERAQAATREMQSWNAPLFSSTWGQRSQDFQNLLSERFQGNCGLLPDLRPDIPSHTEGGFKKVTYLLCFIGSVNS